MNSLCSQRREIQGDSARQPGRPLHRQLGAPGESHLLGARRRPGQSQRQARHRPGTASGSQRPGKGREVPAELQDGRPLSERVAPGQPSGRVLGITAEYTPTIMPGSTTPLRSYRFRGQHRPHRSQTDHPRPQGRHRRHRRQHQQHQLPAHVRPAAHRGLPSRRRALFVPGCKRRTRGHGRRRLALGPRQPDPGERGQHPGATRPGHPLQLLPVETGVPHLPAGAGHGTRGQGLARPDPGEPGGRTLLRRDPGRLPRGEQAQGHRPVHTPATTETPTSNTTPTTPTSSTPRWP